MAAGRNGSGVDNIFRCLVRGVFKGFRLEEDPVCGTDLSELLKNRSVRMFGMTQFLRSEVEGLLAVLATDSYMRMVVDGICAKNLRRVGGRKARAGAEGLAAELYGGGRHGDELGVEILVADHWFEINNLLAPRF